MTMTSSLHRSKRAAAGLLLAAIIGSTLLSACGDDDSDASSAPSNQITVTITDGAFAVAGRSDVGGTVRVVNDGTQMHMMAVARFKPGHDANELRAAASSGDFQALDALVEQVSPAMNVFIAPGRSIGISSARLAAGDYALVDFLPAEGEGMPNVASGMVGTLTVTGGEAPELDPDARYEIHAGSAISGPTSLNHGPNVLELTASGEVDKLEPALFELPASAALAATLDEIDLALSADGGPPAGFGQQFASKFVATMWAFANVRTTYLVIDLDPGSYRLAAIDTEAEAPHVEPTEQLAITVT
jgi:hypothetical protein